MVKLLDCRSGGRAVVVVISVWECESGGGGARRRVFRLLDDSRDEPSDVDSSDNLPETGRELIASVVYCCVEASPSDRNPSCWSSGEGFPVCSSEELEEEKA